MWFLRFLPFVRGRYRCHISPNPRSHFAVNHLHIKLCIILGHFHMQIQCFFFVFVRKIWRSDWRWCVCHADAIRQRQCEQKTMVAKVLAMLLRCVVSFIQHQFFCCFAHSLYIIIFFFRALFAFIRMRKEYGNFVKFYDTELRFMIIISPEFISHGTKYVYKLIIDQRRIILFRNL